MTILVSATKGKSKRLTDLISLEQWKNVISETSFDLIGNSLTELRNLNPKNSKEIFNSIEPLKVAESVKWINFPNFIKTLSELKTFEKKIKDSKARIILNSVEDWRIIKSLEKATI